MVDPIVMGGTLWVSAIPDDSHMLCYAVLGRVSHVQLFETLGTVACQASLSMGFFRQE